MYFIDFLWMHFIDVFYDFLNRCISNRCTLLMFFIDVFYTGNVFLWLFLTRCIVIEVLWMSFIGIFYRYVFY